MAKGNVRKVLRIGNSYGVTVDRDMLKSAGWGWDTPVTVNLERGRIVIARTNRGKPPARRASGPGGKQESRSKRKAVAAAPIRLGRTLLKRTLKARW